MSERMIGEDELYLKYVAVQMEQMGRSSDAINMISAADHIARLEARVEELAGVEKSALTLWRANRGRIDISGLWALEQALNHPAVPDSPPCATCKGSGERGALAGGVYDDGTPIQCDCPACHGSGKEVE